MPEYRVPYRKSAPLSEVAFFNLDNMESLKSFILDRVKGGRVAYGLAGVIYRGEDASTYVESYKYATQFGLVPAIEYKPFVEPFLSTPFDFSRTEDSAVSDRIYDFRNRLNLHPLWYSIITCVLELTRPNLSEKDSDLWAYYQNAEKRALCGSDGKGIRTQIKYGKLLKKLFPMATDSQIAAEVESFKDDMAIEREPLSYHIATDRESFKRVYTGGQAKTLDPRLWGSFKSLMKSCMRHEGDYFDNGDLHPSEVYASGDFAIVWAEKGGKIAARAVVPVNKDWTESNGALRLSGLSAPIYTTTDNASEGLKSFIEANGANFKDLYDTSKAWEKARYKLAKIQVGDAYLMPYVDTNSSADDSGDCFQISPSGSVDIRQTSGKVYLEPQYDYTCGECFEGLDEDSYVTDDAGNCYCESCYSANFFYCHRLQESVPTCETVEFYWRNRYGFTHETVSRDWAEDNAILCEDDGEYWDSDCVIWVEESAYSPSYTEYFVSAWDGETYHERNGVVLSNGETVSLAEVQAEPDWILVNGQWTPVEETLIAAE